MPKAYLLSDRAIQIDWSTKGSKEDIAEQAIQLALIRSALIDFLQSSGCSGFQCIQADQSITVLFANSLIVHSNDLELREQLEQQISKWTMKAQASKSHTGHHDIVVNYGGVSGQDLQWLAEQSGLSTEGVIELHSSATYTVQFLGFLPGFAYLSGLPEQLHFPRRSIPRVRVPAGTLAIGANYCSVYPWESPGGWHLLGHVEKVLFDVSQCDDEGSSLFKAGDTVRFIRADYA